MQSESTKSTLQECSFFLNLFLEFRFLPAFSSFILQHVCVYAFDNLKIPVHSSEYFQKGYLLEPFASSLPLVMPVLHKSEHSETSDLIDHELVVGSFVTAIAFI